MNNHLKKIMNKAWIDWHGDIPAEDIPFPESCNPSFRVGFESACEALLPMLKDADKYHELKDAAIALVQRLELDKDVKKNNWWLNERAKIMEAIEEDE